MAPKIEGQHTGEFLVSEANGTLSREVGTLATRPERYLDGTLLKVDDGNLTAITSDADTIVGVLYGNYDASAGPVEAVYIARLAEVKRELITYVGSDATIDGKLALLYIRPR
jgi:hypothetical protein